MKLKKCFAILVVCALSLSVFAFNASAAGEEVWLSFTDRMYDYSGIDIKLAELVKIPANPAEGFYEVIAVLEPVSGRECAFKILTQGGSDAFAYKRFTPRPKLAEESTLVTRFNDVGEDYESPGEGKIPADFIMEAAANEQFIRICTQTDMNSFTLKQLIVSHNDVVIYDMQKDPALTALADGDNFPEETGTEILQLSGSNMFSPVKVLRPATTTAFNPKVDGATLPTATVAVETAAVSNETATESSTEAQTAAAGNTSAPAASTKGSADTGVEGIAVVAGLALTAAGAVVISRKRK